MLLQKIKIFLLFYKRVFIIPLASSITILLTVSFSPSLLTLIFTSLVIWFYENYINDRDNQKVYFFLNLGFSKTLLYSLTFLLNLLIIIILKLIIYV
jgi:hypothetical protein